MSFDSFSPLLLANTAQRIGVGIAAASIVAWIVYVVIVPRLREPDEPVGSEIELAPNRRPFLDDEGLEGRRLDRYLGWAFLLLVVCSIGPLVYWLNEPARQAGAVEEFDAKAAERGRILFLPSQSEEHGLHFGCADCHGGMNAQGGVAPATITDYLGRVRSVSWAAPRLDDVLKRFSEEEVEQILIYGRANTPMPAWGVEGGGPMNAQQITDLVEYIKGIQVDDETSQKNWAAAAEGEAAKTGLTADSGETLFRANCARCHTKGFSYGEPDIMGGGAFGPNLTSGAALRQFPDRQSMIDFISVGTKYATPYGTRGMGGNEGGGMPGFGPQAADEADGQHATSGQLTQAQIEAIVDYVRGL